MLKTEAEARKCWRPYSNVYVAYQATGAAGNRGLGKREDMQGWDGHARCIASQCMGWRWEMERYTRPGSDPFISDQYKPVRNTGRGYCGLAGKPGEPA